MHWEEKKGACHHSNGEKKSQIGFFESIFIKENNKMCLQNIY